MLLSFSTKGGNFPANEIAAIMTASNKEAADLEHRYTMKCGLKKVIL